MYHGQKPTNHASSLTGVSIFSFEDHKHISKVVRTASRSRVDPASFQLARLEPGLVGVCVPNRATCHLLGRLQYYYRTSHRPAPFRGTRGNSSRAPRVSPRRVVAQEVWRTALAEDKHALEETEQDPTGLHELHLHRLL